MRRQVVIAGFVLALTVLLAGCGAEPAEQVSQDSVSSDVKRAPVEQTQAPVESGEAASVDEQAQDEASADESADLGAVLVDDELMTFTVKSKSYDSFWDAYGYDVEIVNKSDKEIMVGVDGVSVDGQMNDPFWAYSVTAGKTGTSRIEFMDGVDSIDALKNVEGKIRVSDYDTFDTLGEYTFTIQ